MLRFKSLLVIATLSLLLVSFGAGVASASPADAVLAEQVQVVELVNAERAAHGLHPLAMNGELAGAAAAYAEYMAAANFFSHTGPDGSNVVSRAEAAGYWAWSFLAENLAAGQPTPERVVAAWMKSPSHRANILAAEATEVGVAHAYRPGTRYGHYWALEFGTRW